MSWFDGIKGAVADVVGGAQVDVVFGGNAPPTGRVTLGEDRVMSWWIIAGVAVIAYLLGRTVKS